MASLRDMVSEYQDDLRNGIAWLAFWREGRSWQAEAFHLDLDDTLYPEDRTRLAEIQAADPRAIVVNGYYSGYLGEEMNVAELTAGVRHHYDNGLNNIAPFMEAHSDELPPDVLEEAREKAHAAGLPFYERPYRGDDIDPYTYDGHMSMEDYELMQKLMEQDREKDQPKEPAPLEISNDLMLIDTNRAAFDMQAIQNRRFMFSPQTGELILGKQYRGNTLFKSHAEEHGKSGAKAPFDSFLRGWVGTGKDYKDGVIHFAPAIDAGNAEQFDRAFSTLEMFARNGANGKTVIRGFGDVWEQPLSDLIPERREPVSEVFSILLHNRQLYEQGKEGLWLSLPTTTEKLQAALREIGISTDNPQDFFLYDYRSPQERPIRLPRDLVLSADVDELNFLAARLEKLDAAELSELNAALTNPQSDFHSIGQITDYPDNVDFYVHLPDVTGTVGAFIERQSGSMGFFPCFLQYIRRQLVAVSFHEWDNIVQAVVVVVAHTGNQLRHVHFLAQIAGIIAVHHNGPWVGGLYFCKPRSVLWIKSVVQIKVKRLRLPAPALAPERQPCNAVPQVVLIFRYNVPKTCHWQPSFLKKWHKKSRKPSLISCGKCCCLCGSY